MAVTWEREVSHSLQVAVAVAADRGAIAAILADGRRWLAGRGIDQWVAPFNEDWIDRRIAAYYRRLGFMTRGSANVGGATMTLLERDLAAPVAVS